MTVSFTLGLPQVIWQFSVCAFLDSQYMTENSAPQTVLALSLTSKEFSKTLTEQRKRAVRKIEIIANSLKNRTRDFSEQQAPTWMIDAFAKKGLDLNKLPARKSDFSFINKNLALYDIGCALTLGQDSCEITPSVMLENNQRIRFKVEVKGGLSEKDKKYIDNEKRYLSYTSLSPQSFKIYIQSEIALRTQAIIRIGLSSTKCTYYCKETHHIETEYPELHGSLMHFHPNSKSDVQQAVSKLVSDLLNGTSQTLRLVGPVEQLPSLRTYRMAPLENRKQALFNRVILVGLVILGLMGTAYLVSRPSQSHRGL